MYIVSTVVLIVSAAAVHFGRAPVHAAFCLNVALAGLRSHARDSRFVSWSSKATGRAFRQRGLGHRISRPYGRFAWLSPRLSVRGFRAVGVALLAALLLAACPWCPRVGLVLAFTLYFPYFSQMSPSTSTSAGHATILVPSFLFYFAWEPSAAWPCHLARAHLASMYFASGLCKLLASFRYGFWADGYTLQSYIFDALWSRPGGPVVRALQELFLLRPRSLCLVGGVFGLSYELLFPLAVVRPDVFGVQLLRPILVIAGLSFHLGCAVLMDMDFVSYWSPALLSLLVDDSPQKTSDWFCVLRFVPLAYLGCQLYVSLTLYDLRNHEDALPLSCCPMFLLRRSVSDAYPKLFVAAPAKSVEPAGWALEPFLFSPLTKGLCEVTEAELCDLPYRVVLFGHCASVVREVIDADVLHTRFLGSDFLLFGNVALEESLIARLRAFVLDLRTCRPGRAADFASLLGRQRELSRELEEAVLQCPRLASATG